jgi:hypothetical protein
MNPELRTNIGSPVQFSRIPGSLQKEQTFETWVVATPACGGAVRRLSIPEKQAISIEDQESVEEALDELRVKLQGVWGQPTVNLDGDIDPDGAIANVRVRWRTLSPEVRADALYALQTGTPSKNPVVGQLRAIDEMNSEVMSQINQIINSSLSEDYLDWCVTVLTKSGAS